MRVEPTKSSNTWSLRKSQKRKRESMRLKDKKIMVVGAAGLIGSEITKQLLGEGAKVIAVDPNAEIMKSVDHLFKVTIGTDINEQEIVEVCSAASSEHKTIHGFVNCSYPRTKTWGKDIFETTVEDFRANMDLHLNSYFIWMRSISKVMVEQKQGSIVNFGSIYGMRAPRFEVYAGTTMSNTPTYAAIKSGITHLTKYFASSLGKFGVRANVVSPGGVFDNQNETFVNNYCNMVPLRRMATPQDIAKPTAFLLSDEAAYISGVELPVDGGWTAV